MTRVSVIMAVRNAAEHIQAAFNSVGAQTRVPDECIVVVGASTDNTVEIVRKQQFADVVLQSDIGLGDARNLGVARATGDVIAFLDADDVWAPEKTEQQLRLLSEHHGGVVVAGMMTRISKAGVVGAPAPGFTPSAVLVPRSAFDAVGLFNNQFRIACDTDWFLRCRELGLGPVVANDVVVLKGVRDDSLSVDIKRYQAEMLAVVRAAAVRLDAKRTRPT